LENQFCSLSVWDLLRLTPWVFWSEILTRHWSLCLLSFGWDLSPKFEPQDLQSIFYSSLSGPKGRFVCVQNCLIFSPRRILICLTWNLSRFVQNTFEILTWSFRKKLFRENFSEILCKPRLYTLPKLVKFGHTFCNFFWVRIALKKFTRVPSYVVYT